jgi:outer membrane biosynthesis protein TonB
VFEAIEAADTFLVFGTRDYGEDTSNPASTYYEAEFALGLQKRILLIRMFPWEQKFDHIMGRILFGMNRLTLDWQLGTAMPSTLPGEIVRALELGDEQAPEPEPEPEPEPMVEPEPEPEPMVEPEPEPEPIHGRDIFPTKFAAGSGCRRLID